MTSPTTARALGLGSLRAQTARYCQVSIMETPRESDDVFKIDEEYSDSGSGKSPASEDRESRPERPALDLMPAPSTGANEEIELSRRAVPVVELDADVCSICLDEFTSEDPEQHTACECVSRRHPHPLRACTLCLVLQKDLHACCLLEMPVSCITLMICSQCLILRHGLKSCLLPSGTATISNA